ncbi:ParB/RepB/Spo0J family partition protein [Nostoc sp. 'Lobaria pulmonaria (5183) cyanobiont']|uniref:ParB/RepB/Spo0J family partition protein n=1 Tax=Nostoc sp. 'Lobaria pulmonaria (5183) cyanobiont' TaxID=1618022 RepID=UPI000CF321F0|nr:ParB/RepB/Spo0J family partition protein [Nostoc sp. 'Lobaria pulmonaria (5183) cyanobiont']AVH72769.1 chromosome/plasmid partitioning protein ParB [Nostoc sp. 'Lobaria pulmonaria (5183) cyanobiont']
MTITENSVVKEIPLDQIDIGLSQVRTSDIDQGIQELAASIEKIGLLEPIVVSPKAEERYEVVTGQRRFLAHQYLGHETIRATILAEPVEPEIAKAISLTENMVRQNLSTKDYIDACTELYRKYGSIKKISDTLGLPYYKVSQYVKYEQLIEPLKEKVESGLKLDVALRAQKAATDSSSKEVNKEAAIIYAEEMQKMSGLQQRQIEKVAIQEPSVPPKEVIQRSRRQQQMNLRVVVGDKLYDALNQFTQDEEIDQNNAVITLLEAALSERGYL